MIPAITGLKEAPAEFLQRLREIDPVRDLVSYLLPVWREFYDDDRKTWEPRWVLYEMVPAYEGPYGPTVPLAILEELKGVDPELIPETCPLISHLQWLLYQKYQRWARPSLVVQGTKGGTLACYDHATVKLCEYLQRPTTPPAPGTLAYAPLDERVIQQVLRMNKMVMVRNDLDEFRRVNAGEGGKRTFREKLRAAREEYIRFLDEQFEEPAGHFVDAYRKGEFDAVGAPKLDRDWVELDEKESHQFIETGSFTTPVD